MHSKALQFIISCGQRKVPIVGAHATRWQSLYTLRIYIQLDKPCSPAWFHAVGAQV